MSIMERWLSSVSGFASNPIQYASQLEKAGYETPEGILAAGEADVLSRDCGLKIGVARRIWEAAGGPTRGELVTQLQDSLAFFAVHQLSGPSGLSRQQQQPCMC